MMHIESKPNLTKYRHAWNIKYTNGHSKYIYFFKKITTCSWKRYDIQVDRKVTQPIRNYN